MEHQIPQFIEIEDKVIGPLTIKQFLYLSGGAAAAFIAWTLLPRFLAIAVAIPIAGLAFALSFYKVNGKPFIFMVENAFNFLFSTKIYIWKKKEKLPEKGDRPSEDPNYQQVYVPRLSESKLKNITWSLDINDTMNQPWQNK
jgi:hypothetical protein